MKYFYTKREIFDLLKEENPNSDNDELMNRAVNIHRTLNTLDIGWKRKNKKFYDNMISFDLLEGCLTQGEMNLAGIINTNYVSG